MSCPTLSEFEVCCSCTLHHITWQHKCGQAKQALLAEKCGLQKHKLQAELITPGKAGLKA